MIITIASAPAPVPQGLSIELILITAGVMIAVTLLAGVLFVISGKQKNREIITAVLIFWSLATAGSVSYFAMQQMNWSTDQERRIESGYYDPNDVSDKPKPPTPLWSGLAIIYMVTAGWAIKPSKER